MADLMIDGILENEQSVEMDIYLHELAKLLSIESIRVVFIDEEADGDYRLMNGCFYEESMESIYIQVDEHAPFDTMVGMLAHCMYAVTCIKNGIDEEIWSKEADIFGDIYQSYHFNDSELMTEGCTAQHLMIICAHGDRYWNAIGSRSNDKQFRSAMVTCWSHYINNAWDSYKKTNKAIVIDDDALQKIDRAEDLYAPELYIALAKMSIMQQAEYLEKVKKIARRYDIEQDVNSLYIWFERKQPASFSSNTYTGNVTEFKTLPKGVSNLKCGAFVADEQGVRIRETKKNAEGDELVREIPLSETPMTIFKIYDNYSTHYKLVLLAFKDIEWETLLLTAQDILNTTGLFKKELAGRGAIVKNYKALSRYLTELIMLNKNDKLRYNMCSDKLGWHGNELVPYSDKCLFFNTNLAMQTRRNAIQCEGRADEWIKMVNDIRAQGYSLVKIALGASFSSVLIKNFHLSNTYIVGFYGKPKSGKSVMLSLAASIWGHAEKLLDNFNQTIPFIFNTAGFLQDFPLLLDDTANLSKEVEKDFTNLIYSLFAGVGKGKMQAGGSVAPDVRWNSCTILTGEQPTTSLVEKQGAVTRILDIPTPDKVFSEESTYSYVTSTLKDNYGHAGRIFVESITNIGPYVIKDLFDRYIKLLQELSYTKDAYDMRTKQPMAGILLADRIASLLIYKDDDNALSVKEFVDALKIQSSSVDKNKDCYDYVVENCAEMIREGNGLSDDTYKDYIIFRKEFFRNLAAQFDLEPDKFARWLKDKDLLITDKGKTTKNKRIEGSLTPVYFVKSTGLKNAHAEETDDDRVLEEQYCKEIDDIIKACFGGGSTPAMRNKGKNKVGIDYPLNSAEAVAAATSMMADENYIHAFSEYQYILFINDQEDQKMPQELLEDVYYQLGKLYELYLPRKNYNMAQYYYRIASGHADTKQYLKKLNDYYNKLTEQEELSRYMLQHNEDREIVLEAVALFVYSELETEINKETDPKFLEMYKGDRLKSDIESFLNYNAHVNCLVSPEDKAELIYTIKHMLTYEYPELTDFDNPEEVSAFIDDYSIDKHFQTNCNQSWIAIVKMNRWLPDVITSFMMDYITDQEMDSEDELQKMMLDILDTDIEISDYMAGEMLRIGNADVREAVARSDGDLSKNVLTQLAKDSEPAVRRAVAGRVGKLPFNVKDLLKRDADESVRAIMAERE